MLKLKLFLEGSVLTPIFKILVRALNHSIMDDLYILKSHKKIETNLIDKLDFSVTLVFVRSKEQIVTHHEKTRLWSF